MIEARIAYRLADLVLPVSTAQLDAMKEKGLKANYAVVPNVIDRKIFYPPDLSKPAPAASSRLLFVGALRGKFGKGLPELLPAMCLLLDRSMEVRLTVIGTGPRKIEAEEMAHNLGLAGYVSFVGGVSISEVANAMRNSHLLVAPSTTPETFALPVAEAQACGLPVVASCIGAIPETLGTSGILVTPGDPVALADGIEEALRNYECWDRRAIVNSTERFCAHHVVDQIERLYAGLGV